MNFSNTILNELKEISPALAEMPRLETPYLVPENYFNSLSNSILNTVQGLDSENQELNNILSTDLRKGNAYEAPAGYFEGFSAKMLALVKSQPVALENADVELQSIAPVLAGISRNMPFSVPEGYFETFPGLIQSGLQLEEVYPGLADLNQKPTYQVPEGYFEGLTAQVVARVKASAQPGKLVSFGRRWMRMAAAAAITGLLVTGAFLSYQNNQVSTPADPINELSSVSDQEILNYMQNQEVPALESGGTNMAVSNFTDNDVKDLMSDVSDAELEQYAQSQDPQSN